MTKKLEILNLGNMRYKKAYELQLELIKKRAAGEIPDTLILVEHPPVFTIGSSGTDEHISVSRDFLESSGIEVFETNRGGDITYHGPGQIVAYPILNLKEHKQDLHWLLRQYEEVTIRLLEKYGITARRIDGLTGVWVGDEKITAIGVGVRRWVSYHGFAFNVNPNLEHFSYIIPCGIRDKGVTSLSKLQGEEMDMDEMRKKVIKYFAEVFEMEVLEDERQIS